MSGFLPFPFKWLRPQNVTISFVVNISFLPFYFEPCLPPIVICSMKDEIDQHYLSNIIVCKCQCYNFKITSQMTADNLHRTGCPNCGSCELCHAAPETNTDLFVHCSFTSQVWQLIRAWSAVDFPIPGSYFLNRRLVDKSEEEGAEDQQVWLWHNF
jgi:hypothetical protein